MKAKVKDILAGYANSWLKESVIAELISSGESPGEEAEVDVGRLYLRLTKIGDRNEGIRNEAIKKVLFDACQSF